MKKKHFKDSDPAARGQREAKKEIVKAAGRISDERRLKSNGKLQRSHSSPAGLEPVDRIRTASEAAGHHL